MDASPAGRVRLPRPRTVAHHHDATHLRVAFVLTLVLLAVEAAAGLAAHSLALLSDAAHNFTDVFALGLAGLAVGQARRPADLDRTFGYHRVGVVAAAVNGAMLILVVVGIAFEAIMRLAHPVPVAGG